MGMNTAIAALLGGLLVGGVVMVGIGIAPIHQLSTGQSTSLWTRVDNWFSRLPRRSRVHGLTGLGIGVVGYVVTGWAVLLVIVPVLAVVVPALLADPPRHDLDVMRALERWVRLVSGSASTGKSVIDAIRATRRQAPELLIEPLTRVVARLDSRWDTRAALQGLADDLDSADADQVIAAIMMAAERGGTGPPVRLTLSRRPSRNASGQLEKYELSVLSRGSLCVRSVSSSASCWQVPSFLAGNIWFRIAPASASCCCAATQVFTSPV